MGGCQLFWQALCQYVRLPLGRAARRPPTIFVLNEVARPIRPTPPRAWKVKNWVVSIEGSHGQFVLFFSRFGSGVGNFGRLGKACENNWLQLWVLGSSERWPMACDKPSWRWGRQLQSAYLQSFSYTKKMNILVSWRLQGARLGHLQFLCQERCSDAS